jgi:glycosyltransferase involved in cell wall biosynthesis
MLSVSTIIPAFNAEHTIAVTINSALSQNWESHEVVVVNDGSTDGTADILKEYGNQIKVITQPNGGLSAARNAGIRCSTGKYLAFLDSDDIWLPGKLEAMVPMLESNSRASLAFSGYTLLDGNGSKCGEADFGVALEQLLDESPLPVCSLSSWILPSTWVTPRTMLERIGGFCEEFKGPGGFDDFWILVLLREVGEFIYVPENLALYRVGDSSSRNADKYSYGLSVFIGLVKSRYGAKGKSLIRHAKERQCRSMLSKIAHQMNGGDKWGAAHTIARIAKLHPAYFLSSEFSERLFLPHNVKRLRELASVRSYLT